MTLTLSNPRDRINDGWLEKSEGLDLAFDPHQPRDGKGRWTDKPGGSLLDSVPSAGGMVMATPAGITDEPAVKNPGQYVATGIPKPAKGEGPSVKTQIAAQNQAQSWFYDAVDGYSGPDEMKAAQVWMGYQNPKDYGSINACLRGKAPTATIDDGRDRPRTVKKAEMEKEVKHMFDAAGVTIDKPMTVYRALRVDPADDWANILTPGTTFQEDGIVSSTAYRRLAQGWLGVSGTGNYEAPDVSKIKPDDVVLEISVPKGSRIVGGTTQFIETMLPPGTRFKITSSTRLRTPNSIDPLTMGPEGTLTYTHVKAEAILPKGYGGK